MRKSEHEKKKQREETRKRKGNLPFSFFPPRQLFACLSLSHLPHYLRGWNTLVSVLTGYLAFRESREMTEQRQRQNSRCPYDLEVSVKKHITSGTPIRFQFRRPSPYKPWPVCLPVLLLLACTLLPGLLLRQIPEKKHKQIFYTKTTRFKKFPNFIFDIFGKSGTQNVPRE